jgi:uncharacterized protein YecE (DUF72 family)
MNGQSKSRELLDRVRDMLRVKHHSIRTEKPYEAWERYNYSYSDEELQEWLPRIQQLDEESPLTLVWYLV